MDLKLIFNIENVIKFRMAYLIGIHLFVEYWEIK